MLGKILSEEIKAKISVARLGKIHSAETRAKISNSKKGTARVWGAGKPTQKVSVFDNNQTTIYESISAAAKALGIRTTAISNYLIDNRKKPYKKRYISKKKNRLKIIFGFIYRNLASAVNLSKRFRIYYSLISIENLLLRYNSYICRALLKYGYSKFTLEILEYCDPKDLIDREQYYIDLFKPKYNILKLASSFLGSKHMEESLANMRGKKRSEKTWAKISSSFSEEKKILCLVKKENYIQSLVNLFHKKLSLKLVQQKVQQ